MHVPCADFQQKRTFSKDSSMEQMDRQLICYDTYDLVSHHLKRYSISTPGRMNAVILPSLTSIYQEDLICRKHYFVQRHEDEAGFLR
mmetsp:Transcript_6041/g.10003  ORF Transcript_6041/g.10003 Transcript_6041/m.10003 type:complete len:87 (-) Transcript_6041:163-423(-)